VKVRDRRPAPDRLLDRLDADPDGGLARALAPLSSVYEALGSVYRSRIHPPRSLPPEPPSVGVGNLRVGGTGKTPVVADLARRLQAEGLRVGILTRGYRGHDGADEPGWLAAAGHVVVVDSDRRRGHAEAARRGCDVVLLDDALQCRDRPGLVLALVLEVDLERPPRVLPAGPAREGIGALGRASCWLVRRSTDGALTARGGRRVVGVRLAPHDLVGPDGEERTAAEAPTLGPVLAVSGLARPMSFEADLRGIGTIVRGSWRGADHWRAAQSDRSDVEDFAREIAAGVIVCPEKNFVRLRALGPGLPVWCLRSRLEWETDDPLGAIGLREWLGLSPPRSEP
jgi:tetraacyldisaccharide 4'-kinase